MRIALILKLDLENLIVIKTIAEPNYGKNT